jgi:hypothetical protein
MVGNWDGNPRDRTKIERMSELRRARNVADWEVAEAENDLLAFLLTQKKPIVMHDWPGHAQTRLRKFMALHEADPGHVPSHD